MVKTLPTIEDITRATIPSTTRRIGEDGLIKFEYSDDGFIQIYEQDCVRYGESTIGLADGAKLSKDDWRAIRTRFDLHHNDGKVTRHYCIGGSSAGVCKGDNLYTTEQELFEEIRNGAEKNFSESQEYAMEFGNSLEELTAIGFSAKTGLPVYKNSMIFFNLRTGFMVANVDYFTKLDDQLYVLEIKTTNYNGLKKWEDGKVPPSYYDQAVLHYPRTLEDLNVAGTFFCCSYNNNLDDLIIRKYDRDIEGEDELEAAERDFVEHLHNNTVPPLRSVEGESAINRFWVTHPVAEETTFTLPETISDTVQQYLALSEEKSIYEKSARRIVSELDGLKVPIMEAMGNNSLGEISLGDKIYVVDMSNRTPRKSISAKNYDLLVAKYPDASEFITEGVSRKFSISAKKVKD